MSQTPLSEMEKAVPETGRVPGSAAGLTSLDLNEAPAASTASGASMVAASPMGGGAGGASACSLRARAMIASATTMPP